MQVVPRKFFALRAERIGAQGVYFFNGGTVMQEKIRELKTKIDEAVQKTETGRALYELKLKFQAELKDIMSGMRELPRRNVLPLERSSTSLSRAWRKNSRPAPRS